MQVDAKVNGYSLKDLEDQLFQHYSSHTASNIERQLERVRQLLADAGGQSIFVSLGENCGPALRLGAVGAPALGAQFFDNLVTPLDGVAALITDGFANILRLRNLRIGVWETNDSVYDEAYEMFYHHYFCLSPTELEKSWHDAGGRRRRIDEADIPLFYPAVRAQFEYLAEKFALVARSAMRKHYVLRKVAGELPTSGEVSALRRALDVQGAANARLVIVHSDPATAAQVADLTGEAKGSAVYLIPETGERWGSDADWQHLVDAELQAS